MPKGKHNHPIISSGRLLFRSQSRAMKIMSWNCRELGNPLTVRALKKMITSLQPYNIFIYNS